MSPQTAPPPPADTPGTDATAPRRRRVRWTFATAAPAVVVLAVIGQVVGHMMRDFPPHRALVAAVRGDGSGALAILGGLLGEMQARDWLFAGFLIATAGFVWVERAAAARFFRALQTGVTLVILVTLAVTAGVLVPQIDGFEDPDQRVDLAAEEAMYRLYAERGYVTAEEKAGGHNQYGAFRWAEGYFLWHMLHLYGIGMPEADLPEASRAGLESFGRRYGEEERANREKRMVAAFTGQAVTREISAWIAEHEDFLWGFFRVATALELNRVYKSNWFAALLFMLATSVALNSFRGPPRRWLSLEKLGYTLAHLGILVLLAGGLVSKLGTDRGILLLDLRDPRPVDTYYRHFDRNKEAQMPFGVSLERFARRDWPALEVYFEGEDFTSRVPRYTLWEGRRIELDFVPDGTGESSPRIAIEVLGLHDRATVGRPNLVESSDPDARPFPVAAIRVDSAAGGEPWEGVLSPLLPDPVLDDPARRWRVRSVFGDDVDPAGAFPAGEAGEEVFGDLFASIAGVDVQPRAWDLPLAGRVAVQGGYEVEVVRATTNFRVADDARTEIRDERPLADQDLGVRAVEVRVYDAEGAYEGAPRWLIEGLDPLEHGLQAQYRFRDLELSVRHDDWRSPGPERWVLWWGETAEPRLVSESGRVVDARAGDVLPLPPPTRVTVEGFFRAPEATANVRFPESQPAADGWDRDFYAVGARGARVRVHFPGEPGRAPVDVDLATTGTADVWPSPDGRFWIRFLENTEMLPFEWRSVLSIHAKTPAGRWEPVDLGPPSAREIRVNDYLYHRGYRFFQTDADVQVPTYSGIGVVYDPGIEIVLVGMYTIIAGTAVAFLVRPIVRPRRGRA